MYPDLVHNRDCGVDGIDPNRSSVGQFLQWREMQRENARQAAVGTRFGFGLRHSELSEPQKQARAVLYLVWFAVVFLCYYGYLQTPGAQAGTATHLSATSATSTGVLAVDLTPTATDPNSNNTTIGPTAPAAPVNPSDPAISLNINGSDRSPSTAVLVFILITVMSVAPSLLLMMTSFTKIFIVLAMTRNALGLNQIPPTQVISGLALFLSLFIMMPTVTEIYDVAAKPYMDGKLPNFTAALQAGEQPIRDFMGPLTREEDIALMTRAADRENPASLADTPFTTLVPAFMISEVRSAFIIGFVIFIPFLVIDLVVGAALMSMGMMMLPPVMISLPFKVLLFVMVDGWGLLTETLIGTYR